MRWLSKNFSRCELIFLTQNFVHTSSTDWVILHYLFYAKTWLLFFFTNFHFFLVSQTCSSCSGSHFCTNLLSQCGRGKRISFHNVCKERKWFLMLNSNGNDLIQCTFKRCTQSLFTLCAGQWFDNLNVWMSWQDVNT